MLTVDEIHTYYGDSHVLQGLSLEVKPGEIVTLLGRNGVGKTTTVNSIIGFVPPRRGRIKFDGTDITSRRPRRPLHLPGVQVPEQLPPRLPPTQPQNITLAARP